MKKWAADFKRGSKSVEDDGQSGCPNDATADEDVKVAHILVMCDMRRDMRSIASEEGKSFWGSKINPNRHLRYKKGFGKMGATDDDR